MEYHLYNLKTNLKNTLTLLSNNEGLKKDTEEVWDLKCIDDKWIEVLSYCDQQAYEELFECGIQTEERRYKQHLTLRILSTSGLSSICGYTQRREQNRVEMYLPFSF